MKGYYNLDCNVARADRGFTEVEGGGEEPEGRDHVAQEGLAGVSGMQDQEAGVWGRPTAMFP